MLGKTNELKFDQLQTFFGSYTHSESMSLQLTKWRNNHPNAEIIQLDYKTYSATDADNGMSWGETVLITYKEG